MTEQNAALAFDRALDGERGISLNGSESLVLTAHAMQTLFDRQQEIPTEEFVMQLEQTLFGTIVIPTEVEGPPAAAVSRPHPAPRPTPIHPNRTRTFPRWAAIAAALILLFGGAGAITLGPFDLHSTPEPSAIPAIGFGTVEASPELVDSTWTVAPPKSTTGSDRPGVISNGIMFRTFTSGGGRPIQAVDLRTGTVLWEDTPIVTQEMLAVVGDMLLVAGSDGIHWQLVALDGRTGEQGWSIELTQRPVGLRVADDRVFVLGNMNLLESYELEDQKLLWSADLSQYDHSPNEYGGVNKFGDLAGDRLAMTDGTIGAIVSNGRLVAVDAADGKVKWADDRMTDGWTRVKVVDGKFVVTAFGGKPLMYDPEATPLPITPIDPAADPCTRVIEPRSGSKPEAAPDIGETIDSFDPQTGESPWGLILPEQYFVWPVDESRLIAQVEQVQSAGVADNGDLFPCLIDGATGAVSETSGDEFVTFIIPSSDQAGTYWGVGALPDGIPFWVSEVDPATANTLPIIDLGKDFSGLRWVQKADGMILVTAQDGTLLGFPASVPNRAAATPVAAPASPVPSGAAWEVDAPGGDKSYFLTYPSIVDGVMYRMLGTNSGPAHIQAIDVTDGGIRWDIVSPVNSTIDAVNSNVFLVAGAESDSPTSTYALVALDTGSGAERWRVSIDTFPVGLLIADNRAFVLSNGNVLEAFDLDTQQLVWREDLSSFITEPVDRSVPIYTDGRLAEIDETIAAVLRNGRIVALDSADGSVRWSDKRTNDGQTSVGVAGGRFVVTAVGKVTMEVGKDPYSVPPSPVAGYDPKTQPCQRTLAPRGGSTTAVVGENGEAVDSFDPQTGDSPWGLRTHAAVWMYPVDDASLIAFIRPGWDSAIGNEDYGIYCRIDGETGAFTETSGSEYADFAMSSAEGTQPIGIGGLGEGSPLYVDVDSPTAQTLPVFDKELGPTVGFFRVQEADGYILISLSDGVLYGLPEDGPRWIPVGPNATPTIWSVDPPEGSDGSNSTSPIVTDDVSVRIVPPQKGLDASHIQTVDLKTGSVLWELEAPIDPTAMATSDDLVLVGGPADDTVDASGLIVALDLRTGAEYWRIATKEPPVELLVADGNLLALGKNDYLQGFDLEHQWIMFETDLGLYDEDGAPANALTRHRLAELDGWVAAITSTGALIQVDASGGSWFGMQLGDSAATTSLDVIDDRFVLIRTGTDKTSGTTLEADSSPLASPTAGLSTCQQVIVKRLGPMPASLAANDQELSSFEPGATEQLSSVSLDAAIGIFPLDDDDLVAVIPPTAQVPNATYCRIDGDTGKASELLDLIPDLVYRDAERGMSGMLVLPNVSGLPIDVDPEIAQALPFFDVDAYGTITWVQATAGGYLITTSTGNLVFLPELG